MAGNSRLSKCFGEVKLIYFVAWWHYNFISSPIILNQGIFVIFINYCLLLHIKWKYRIDVSCMAGNEMTLFNIKPDNTFIFLHYDEWRFLVALR